MLVTSLNTSLLHAPDAYFQLKGLRPVFKSKMLASTAMREAA
jgi:hypothetical protein